MMTKLKAWTVRTKENPPVVEMWAGDDRLVSAECLPLQRWPVSDVFEIIAKAHNVTLNTAKSALQECETYFEERATAEWLADGPHGNREMQLLVEVQHVLASGMSASGRDRETGHEAKPASPTVATNDGDAQPQSGVNRHG